MAHEKLQTITIIDYHSDQSVDIICQYLDEDITELPNIILVDIAASSVNYNGTLISEGNLLAFLKNYPGSISIQIDDNGHLILFISEEENHYTINGDSKLTYEI